MFNLGGLVGTLLGGTDVGNLVSGYGASQGQTAANMQSAAQAQHFFDAETQLYDTSMQRRVADLKAAGLNPALAYQLGGAGVPGGQFTTNPQNAAMPMANAMNQVSQNATSAAQVGLSMSQNAAQIDLLRSQANANNAQAVKTAGDTISPGLTDKRVQADIAYQEAQANFINGAQTNKAIADVGYTQSMDALATAQRAQVYSTIDKMGVEMKNIQAQTGVATATQANVEMDTRLKNMQRLWQSLSNEQKTAAQPYFIQSAANEFKLQTAAVPKEQNAASFSQSPLGHFVQATLGIGPGDLGAAAAGAFEALPK